MKKKLLSIVSVTIAIALLSGCTMFTKSPEAVNSAASGTAAVSGSSGKSSNPSSVTMYVPTEILSLSQLAASDNISFTVLNNSFEGLYRLDKDNQPQPALATDYKVSDDKLTYTFTLRDGIKWSNGDPITSNDFKFAWLKQMSADATNGYSFIMTDYIVNGKEYGEGKAKAEDVGITTPDDKTLVVKIKNPTPFFLRLTAFVPFFALNEKFVTSQGANYGISADNMPFSGPFKISQYDTAAGVTFVKNENYWDAANVKLGSFKLKVIKEQGTALNLYKSGELARVNLSAADVPANKSNPEFSSENNFSTVYLQFNTTADGIKNQNIRKALGLAIDRTALTETILSNGSVAASGLIPVKMNGLNGKSFRDMAGDVDLFDAAKAKEYWDKGVKELGAVPKLTVVCEDTSAIKDVATFIQSEIKKNLGVEIVIDSKTKKARNALMDGNQYQMGITAWGADYDDAMTYLDLWTGHSPYRGNYTNADYDKLINDAKSETDEAKRADMLIAAEKKLVAEDDVLSPLFYNGYAYLTKSNIQSIITHPYGSPLDMKYVTVK